MLMFSVKPTHGLMDCSSVTNCSVTNTLIQRVWVEHRFEASLDRWHVVREAAGERRCDSAEL